VREADIIVTATEIRKHPAPSIRPEWIKPGAFCMPVDFDAQFTPEAIRAMDLFYTDDAAQMEFYRSAGYFQATPKVQGDLGEVVAARKPGRGGSTQRTMAMHLGLAIEDVVTAVREGGPVRRATAAAGQTGELVDTSAEHRRQHASPFNARHAMTRLMSANNGLQPTSADANMSRRG